MKTFLIWFFASEASWQMGSPPSIKAPPAFLLLCFMLWIYSAVWVVRDAAQRGKSRVLAVVFVLGLYWPFSILFWRWLRPPVSVPPALPKAAAA